MDVNETEDDVTLNKGNVQLTGGFVNGKFVQEGYLRPLSSGEVADEVSHGTVGEADDGPAVSDKNTVDEIRAELARQNITIPAGTTTKSDLLKLFA